LDEAFMSKLLQLFFAVFLMGLGAWGIFSPLPAPLDVAEISGSKVNTSWPYRNEQNALGGGDFATFVPGAFVTIRFARPYQFTTVRHTYPFTQLKWLRITAAEIQWSDDGSAWQVADTARAVGGTMYFSVGAAGAHEWWRMVVTGWAGLPDHTLGNLWFDPADRPFRIPYDIAWALLCAGVIGLLLLVGALTRHRMLTLVTAAAVAFVFSYALLLTPYQIIAMPDSSSYALPVLTGSYDSLRSIGYPSLVWLVDATLGLGNLAAFQLLFQLISLGVLAFVVGRCYGPYIGVVVILGGTLLFSGWLVYYAPFLLIEATTAAALLLAAAGVIGAARHPGTGMFALAGGGLALATLAKSTGFVVAVAALPIIRFVVRGRRLQALMLIVAPAVAAYLLMSLHHFVREGVFAPEVEGGLVLAGHVGWMLHGELPDHPGLMEKLKESVEPSLMGKRPAEMNMSSLPALDEYVDYTAGLEAWMLWGEMMPALRQYDPNMSGIEQSRVLRRVALMSIAADPLAYLRHVAAHFYGMWREVGEGWTDLRAGAVGFRSAYDLHTRVGPFIALLGQPWTADKVREAARSQETVRLASADLLHYLAPRVRNRLSALIGPMKEWSMLREYVALGLGAISLLICAAFFLPGQFAVAIRAEIMLAFMLNAYMLGHAWVVPTIERFAAPVIPIAFAFALCLLTTTWHYLTRNRPTNRGGKKGGQGRFLHVASSRDGS
jgi:hypothetical protein